MVQIMFCKVYFFLHTRYFAEIKKSTGFLSIIKANFTNTEPVYRSYFNTGLSTHMICGFVHVAHNFKSFLTIGVEGPHA